MMNNQETVVNVYLVTKDNRIVLSYSEKGQSKAEIIKKVYREYMLCFYLLKSVDYIMMTNRD